MALSLAAAGIIGAGISALGGLAGGGMSYKNQKKLQRQQNEYNKENAEIAWQRSIDFWNRQNLYNSPAEQIKRLKAAGLNPNLMYGNGSSSTGNAGDPPQYRVPESAPNNYRGDFGISQAANAVSNGINQYVSVKRQLAEINGIEAKNALTMQDVKLRSLQSISEARKTAKSDVELRYLDDMYRAQLRSLDDKSMQARTAALYLDQQRLQFEARRPLEMDLLANKLQQLQFMNSLNPLTRQHLAYRIANLALQYKGRELENHITQVLIDSGVNLRGGAMERGVSQTMDTILNGEGDWKDLLKGLAVGAMGFLTK